MATASSSPATTAAVGVATPPTTASHPSTAPPRVNNPSPQGQGPVISDVTPVTQATFPSAAAVCQQHERACSLLNLSRDTDQPTTERPQPSSANRRGPRGDAMSSSCSSSTGSDCPEPHQLPALHRHRRFTASGRHQHRPATAGAGAGAGAAAAGGEMRRRATRSPSITSASPSVGVYLLQSINNQSICMPTDRSNIYTVSPYSNLLNYYAVELNLIHLE